MIKSFMGFVGVLGVVASLVGTSDSAADSACSSASTCSRQPACAMAYSLKTAGNEFYCQWDIPAEEKNPTCGPHSMVDDWKWLPSQKKCHRKKGNGDIVYSTANIECSSGSDYSSSKGKCVSGAKTSYSRPQMSTAALVTGVPPSLSSKSSAQGAPSCTSGFSLIKSVDGTQFYCKNVEEGATHTPTCGPHSLVDDWKWSPSQKKCSRKKANGDSVYSSANIECRESYTFSAASGLCKKPGGTYYSTPKFSF